ncbi:MAG TPA: hypothetical protein VL793_02280 [Patescibacteria group bacterium]|jgi:hypothetical protein|nr:hypothetical protein [Patescibacteria group bacterium]
MTDTQVKVPRARLGLKIAVRVGSFLLAAALIGAVLNRVSASLERNARPAGFARGIVQGALMPMSLPNLLAGRDITIYSQNNTGVSYKIGYTTGVNGCGALFFGLVFWRFTKMKRTSFAEKPVS